MTIRRTGLQSGNNCELTVMEAFFDPLVPYRVGSVRKSATACADHTAPGVIGTAGPQCSAMAANDEDLDQRMRNAAFAHVRMLNAARDHLSSSDLLAGFMFEGLRFPLINPQRGIFKPKQMRYLLSIRTVFPRPGAKIWYDDQRRVHEQWRFRFILETSVGRGRVCGYGGAGQGAMRRNSSSIPTSCNAAMRRQKRAICPVAIVTRWVRRSGCGKVKRNKALWVAKSGQLRFLGSFVILHLPHHLRRDWTAAEAQGRKAGNRMKDDQARGLLRWRPECSAHEVSDHLAHADALVMRQLPSNGVQVSRKIDGCSHDCTVMR